ncbi:MAG: phytanoyl-CoA dioxygenase family protein [Porticoccaceae bacterium]
MSNPASWLAQANQEIKTRGFTLIPDFLNPERLALVRAVLADKLGAHHGRNNFEGVKTERIYTLVAVAKVFEDIVEDARVMALCDLCLAPNYLLTASQAICIYPGETPQPWHNDDAFYPIPRPRPMVSLSTIVAVDDFTQANGATEIIPGSHLWSEEAAGGDYRLGDSEDDPHFDQRVAGQSIPVEMPAGTCMVFAGNVLHRGGANHSDCPRRAFSNQYCQPWARTQENFFLAIPPARVGQMSDKLQSLLGYSIHPPFMGHLTAYHPRRALEPGFESPGSKRLGKITGRRL